MERKPVCPDRNRIPVRFHPLLEGAAVYDSSCSREARVLYIEKQDGYFLKSAPAGTLKTEADLTAFFHQKGLAAEVLGFESAEQDWLLTRAVPGEDCIHPVYLDDPVRLCDTTAALLRQLHEKDPDGCPVPDRSKTYLATAARNYRARTCDASLFPDNWGYASAEEAWKTIERDAHLLKTDVLLHGDYCLPNIILKDWRFSGFIDLGNGGVGDRHIDLFWGAWTLSFNLKTDKYRERFLDAYGRWDIEPEMFRLISAIEVFG